MNITTVFYSQEAILTFWCPMRFQWYPLDQQICIFRIGSFAFDNSKMSFKMKRIEYLYHQLLSNTILDHSIEILPLDEEHKFTTREKNMTFSVTGFKMVLNRQFLKYFLNYYLPSGLFVVVSWVGFCI